jgi:hypothetical protein
MTTKKTASGSNFPKVKQTEEISMEDIIEDSEKMKLLEKERRKQQMQKDKERSQDRITVNCWVCLVFQTETQADKFTEQMEGVANYLDSYYDGVEFAKKIGFSLPDSDLPPHNRKVNEALAALVDQDLINEASK